MSPDPLFQLDGNGLTRPREECLSATLDRVFAAHPFCRGLFAGRGIARRDLSMVDDLARVD